MTKTTFSIVMNAVLELLETSDHLVQEMDLDEEEEQSLRDLLWEMRSTAAYLEQWAKGDDVFP